MIAPSVKDSSWSCANRHLAQDQAAPGEDPCGGAARCALRWPTTSPLIAPLSADRHRVERTGSAHLSPASRRVRGDLRLSLPSDVLRRCAPPPSRRCSSFAAASFDCREPRLFHRRHRAAAGHALACMSRRCSCGAGGVRANGFRGPRDRGRRRRTLAWAEKARLSIGRPAPTAGPARATGRLASRLCRGPRRELRTTCAS